MLATLSSVIILTAFLISAGFLIYRLPTKKAADMVLQTLHGALMGLGGLLFAGFIMRVLSLETAPLLSAILVVVGSMTCLLVYCLFTQPSRSSTEP